MAESLLTTKYHVPSVRRGAVHRPELLNKLNSGLHRSLTLLCAPAGFGKSTLVAQWVDFLRGQPGEESTAVACGWYSAEATDNDLSQFVAYLIGSIASSQGIDLGEPPVFAPVPLAAPARDVIVPILNRIHQTECRLVVVIDDYHLIEADEIHTTLAFLLEHMPPNMHLVIATRHDPQLPLARLRARDEMTEIRATDLRFTPAEVALFMRQTMRLDLTDADVDAIGSRTEGWPVGLQLAAKSLEGQTDVSGSIASFAGSQRHIADYLVEDVLHSQDERTQSFLLKTSILGRMCGDLCDAITGSTDGQAMLEHLERTNMFLLPLDDQRVWYRYHHLFADLLSQRLIGDSAGDSSTTLGLHVKASDWFQANGYELEAFLHAAAGNDIDRAEKLVEGNGLPLPFRGVVTPVIQWLSGIPQEEMDKRPSLWVAHAMALLVSGKTAGVEEKLLAAEAALGDSSATWAQNLRGRIADTRGTAVVSDQDPDLLRRYAEDALNWLAPEDLVFRSSAAWKLGAAHEFAGDLDAAADAYGNALAMGRDAGNTYVTVVATVGLGDVFMARNRLREAVATFEQALRLAHNTPVPVGCQVHLCLARIYYQRNELDLAARHTEEGHRQSIPFAGQHHILVEHMVFQARLARARAEGEKAREFIRSAWESARENGHDQQYPAIAAEEIQLLLADGDGDAAMGIAEKYELPMSLARIQMARGMWCEALESTAGCDVPQQAIRDAERRLEVMAVRAIALRRTGDNDGAFALLSELINHTKTERIIRVFLDEGPPMARLLYEAVHGELDSQYAAELLTMFDNEAILHDSAREADTGRPDIAEPISRREVDVLKLLVEGLSNEEIGERLFISLHTVKAHTRNIYAKLDVHSRTEAAARARRLGLVLD